MKKLICFALTCYTACAHSGVIGDWIDGEFDDGEPYVMSLGRNNTAIWKSCDHTDATCTWRVGLVTSCEAGASYPALINSDSGASQHTLQCEGKITVSGNAIYRYSISNPDAIDTAVSSGSTLGVVYPLAGGNFQVVRFATKLGAAAVKKLAEAYKSPPKKAILKGSVL